MADRWKKILIITIIKGVEKKNYNMIPIHKNIRIASIKKKKEKKVSSVGEDAKKL